MTAEVLSPRALNRASRPGEMPSDFWMAPSTGGLIQSFICFSRLYWST